MSGSPSSARRQVTPWRICMNEASTAITAPSVRSSDWAPVENLGDFIDAGESDVLVGRFKQYFFGQGVQVRLR